MNAATTNATGPLTVQTISPRRLSELIGSGQAVELIDVRTPAEYREAHIGCARNVPLDRLEPASLIAERRGRSEPLCVICWSGGRARAACERLMAAGAVQVLNVEGGTQAWEQAGLPVIRGKKTISLERQVRIAAGSLVLIGVALGALVHPYLIGLSAFVGAGLVFAGITDTCGMGMLLARMPWNQAPAPADQGHSANGGCCSVKTPPMPSDSSPTQSPPSGDDRRGA